MEQQERPWPLFRDTIIAKMQEPCCGRPRITELDHYHNCPVGVHTKYIGITEWAGHSAPRSTEVVPINIIAMLSGYCGGVNQTYLLALDSVSVLLLVNWDSCIGR